MHHTVQFYSCQNWTCVASSTSPSPWGVATPFMGAVARPKSKGENINRLTDDAFPNIRRL